MARLPASPSSAAVKGTSTTRTSRTDSAIGAGLFERLDQGPIWDALLAEEPPPFQWIAGEGLDALGEAIGRFVDLRSPFTLGHSNSVARLAEGGARTLGLSEPDATSIDDDLARLGYDGLNAETPTCNAGVTDG